MINKFKFDAVTAMKQITNKEYEEWQKYKAEKAKGHVLLPDTVRFICEANGYERFFLVNHLIGGPEKQFFYFILGKRRCSAFFAFKLVIALPDDLPVGIVAVPDLWTVPAATVGALDLAGENADRTQAVLALLAGSHQRLDHLEGFRRYDGFVVVTHIVLWDLALVHKGMLITKN